VESLRMNGQLRDGYKSNIPIAVPPPPLRSIINHDMTITTTTTNRGTPHPCRSTRGIAPPLSSSSKDTSTETKARLLGVFARFFQKGTFTYNYVVEQSQHSLYIAYTGGDPSLKKKRNAGDEQYEWGFFTDIFFFLPTF